MYLDKTHLDNVCTPELLAYIVLCFPDDKTLQNIHHCQLRFRKKTYFSAFRWNVSRWVKVPNPKCSETQISRETFHPRKPTHRCLSFFFFFREFRKVNTTFVSRRTARIESRRRQTNNYRYGLCLKVLVLEADGESPRRRSDEFLSKRHRQTKN